MYMLYYFIKNVATSEQKMEVTAIFIGDIGDHIFINGEEYVIEDYAEEFSDLEESEDFNY